jgi:hypothetical protein
VTRRGRVGLWLEPFGKGMKRRFQPVIGWTLGYTDFGKELYYCGGGPQKAVAPGSKCCMSSFNRGPVARFTENGHYCVYYATRARGEEVALMIALDDEEYLGKLYLCGVTALGVVAGSAKLSRR